MWHSDAFIVLAQRCKELKAWREEEEKTGYQRWGAAQALCIQLNEPEEEPEQDNAAEEPEQDNEEDLVEDDAEEDDAEDNVMVKEKDVAYLSFEEEE